MKRIFLAFSFALACSFASFTCQSASAGQTEVILTDTCVCRVLTGYRYEVRYTAVRSGILGCRRQCVPVCCKVPVYTEIHLGGHDHHNHEGIAPNIHDESGARVRYQEQTK